VVAAQKEESRFVPCETECWDFSIFVGNCKGLLINFHSRTGGLKQEINYQRSIGIVWPRVPACMIAPE
jgi:hypothetical protein